MEDRMNKVKQEEKKKKGTVNNCPSHFASGRLAERSKRVMPV